MAQWLWRDYEFQPSLRYELNAYLFDSDDLHPGEPKSLPHIQPLLQSYRSRQQSYPLDVADECCESWRTMSALDHRHQLSSLN